MPCSTELLDDLSSEVTRTRASSSAYLAKTPRGTGPTLVLARRALAQQEPTSTMTTWP